MSRTLLRLVSILSILCIIPASVAMGDGSIADREWQQEALLRDALDGSLDDFSLLHASLVASGSRFPPGDLDRYQGHAARCLARLPEAANTTQRAQSVFRYLHDHILLGPYREQSSSLSETLQLGHYNCVTSTVLLICLCREAGIPASAVAVPNHVLVQLDGDRRVLIETTDSHWQLLSRFDPRIPGIHQSREISDIALLSRFYYNQAIRWACRSNFRRAIEAAQRSCQLDPDDPAAQANLLATFNNWSIQLCTQGNFEGAAALVRQGLMVNASYAPLVANDAYVHQRWIHALRQEGQSRQADEVEQQLHQRLGLRRGDVPPFDNRGDAK